MRWSDSGAFEAPEEALVGAAAVGWLGATATEAEQPIRLHMTARPSAQSSYRALAQAACQLPNAKGPGQNPPRDRRGRPQSNSLPTPAPAAARPAPLGRPARGPGGAPDSRWPPARSPQAAVARPRRAPGGFGLEAAAGAAVFPVAILLARLIPIFRIRNVPRSRGGGDLASLVP